MKSELVPSNGDPPIPIVRDITLIGRRDCCDVKIDHPGMSQRHCLLVRTDGLLVVRDLITTNGTKVNGQRVSWAALLPNDKMTIGGYKVRVYLGPDNVPAPSEQQAARPTSSRATPRPPVSTRIDTPPDASAIAESPEPDPSPRPPVPPGGH